MKNRFLSLTLLAAVAASFAFHEPEAQAFSVSELLAPQKAEAAAVGRTEFEKVIYVSAYMTSTQSAAYSGVDYRNAKGFYDGDLWDIPAGTVIEDMYVVVDEAVAGISLFELGDDDDANDFIASATNPLQSTGLHYDELTSRGAYLKLAGQNFRKYKYYAASGKELKLNVTGTATTGKIRVVVKGYVVGTGSP